MLSKRYRRILEDIADAIEDAEGISAARIKALVAERRSARASRLDAFLDTELFSDARVYLEECASTDERTRDHLRRVFEIQVELDRRGVWEETDEWRISTTGTERLELTKARRYVAGWSCDGVYRVEFRTFAEAFEAMKVIGQIDRDLFYAVGWPSWAGPNQMSADDPEPPREYAGENPYLERLSREALEDAAAERDIRGSGRETYEVVIQSRSFTIQTTCPTAQRAAEFAGIYRRLQSDLARILEWDWV